MSILTVALVALAMVLAGCAQQPAEAPAGEAAAPEEPAAAPPEQTEAVPPGEALLHPSALNEQAPATYKVRMTTSKGDVVIAVTRDWAPLGADRFYNLVKNGFYDECRFFRVVANFIVQFGMNGDPEIQQAWTDATMPDDPVVKTNGRGRVTFAKTDAPNSRTTQVFINYKSNRALDDQGFAPFGEVEEGMDVVDKIFAGYGQLPDQSLIASQGNKYLTSKFPNLDYIKTTTIVE